jgi:hypothetical protein
MIKEKIPELQKLSTADKFALAVELWDALSFLRRPEKGTGQISLTF